MSLGAHRHSHADLASPLRHRDQEDIHDPNAPDQQRDRGQRKQHEGEGLIGPLLHLCNIHLGPDGKVIRLVRLEPVPGPQYLADGSDSFG